MSESRPKRDVPPSASRGGGDYRGGSGYDSNRGPERDSARYPGNATSSSSSSQVQFWVGNLSYRTTDRTLSNVFRSHGEVAECSVPIHRETGKPRGYAFVTLSNTLSPKDVSRICRELDGMELDGRNITVSEARNKDRSGSGAPSSLARGDRGRGDAYDGGRRGYSDRDDYRSSSRFEGKDNRSGGRSRGEGYERAADFDGG